MLETTFWGILTILGIISVAVVFVWLLLLGFMLWLGYRYQSELNKSNDDIWQ